MSVRSRRYADSIYDENNKMNDDTSVKMIKNIYRNLLEGFNPYAKQIISSGKAYLKAMHNASSAADTYIQSISKLAKCSQGGIYNGSSDIGEALVQLVKVHKEVQSLQANVLTAFYVDLVVPLEKNLEKDTKAVTIEQKRFVQNLKGHNESVSKAMSDVKKHRKKVRNGRASTTDKELRKIKTLEDRKNSSDEYMNNSLKQAIRQERRRYGFVLERQCSLTKHYLVYHNKANKLYHDYLPQWEEVSKSRELLPEHLESMFPNDDQSYSSSSMNKSMTEHHLYNNNKGDDHDMSMSNGIYVRRAKSVENIHPEDSRSIISTSSTLRRRSHTQHSNMPKARSEVNLNMAQPQFVDDRNTRPKSMVVENDVKVVRAIYSYLSKGENQLSFLEGDMIVLIGERNNGWQFGENLRNSRNGWFPVAYTEDYNEEDDDPSGQEIHFVTNSTRRTSVSQQSLNHVQQPSNHVQQPSNHVQQLSNHVQQLSNHMQQSLNRKQPSLNRRQQSVEEVRHSQPASTIPHPPPAPPLPESLIRTLNSSTNSKQLPQMYRIPKPPTPPASKPIERTESRV